MVTGSYPPMRCGVGDYTALLSQALCQEPGVTVEVVTSASAGSVPGSCADVAPVMKNWSVTSTFAFMRKLYLARADVVHIQYPTQGYGSGKLPEFAPLLARLAGAVVVATWHEPIEPRAVPSLLLRVLAWPQVIVVRSDFRTRLKPIVRWLLRPVELKYIAGGSAIPSVHLTPGRRAELRRQYAQEGQRLVVYFGFIYPQKGVDLLFDIADSRTDFLLIIGDPGRDAAYTALLAERAGGKWTGKVAFEGYLDPHEVAERLGACDAVILPFRAGGGEWNSSIHAARANSAYVVTTSLTRRDYDISTGTAYCPVDDIGALREGLALAATRQRPSKQRSPAAAPEWAEAARSHLEVYRQAIGRAGTSSKAAPP